VLAGRRRSSWRAQRRDRANTIKVGWGAEGNLQGPLDSARHLRKNVLQGTLRDAGVKIETGPSSGSGRAVRAYCKGILDRRTAMMVVTRIVASDSKQYLTDQFVKQGLGSGTVRG
jgi:hypothetical protein